MDLSSPETSDLCTCPDVDSGQPLAIILKHSPFEETSALVSACTPTLGLVRVLAKGIRRPKSPLTSLLNPLVQVRLHFSPRAKRRLADDHLVLVSQAQPVASWGALHQNADALALGMTLGEVVAHGLKPHDPHAQDIFDALSQALGGLDALAQSAPLNLRDRLVWQAVCGHVALMQAMGVALVWDTCVVSGVPWVWETLPSVMTFFPALGGVTAASHTTTVTEGVRVSVSRSTWQTLAQAAVQVAALGVATPCPATLLGAARPEKLLRFLTYLWQGHLERPLHSMAWAISVLEAP